MASMRIAVPIAALALAGCASTLEQRCHRAALLPSSIAVQIGAATVLIARPIPPECLAPHPSREDGDG